MYTLYTTVPDSECDTGVLTFALLLGPPIKTFQFCLVPAGLRRRSGSASPTFFHYVSRSTRLRHGQREINGDRPFLRQWGNTRKPTLVYVIVRVARCHPHWGTFDQSSDERCTSHRCGYIDAVLFIYLLGQLYYQEGVLGHFFFFRDTFRFT